MLNGNIYNSNGYKTSRFSETQYISQSRGKKLKNVKVNNLGDKRGSAKFQKKFKQTYITVEFSPWLI